MVAMGDVVARAQHAIEEAAGAAMHLPQEARGDVVALVPVLLHPDAPAVGEHEACHIQCIGRRVATAPSLRSTVDIAAGVAAVVLEPDQGLAEGTYSAGVLN